MPINTIMTTALGIQYLRYGKSHPDLETHRVIRGVILLDKHDISHFRVLNYFTELQHQTNVLYTSHIRFNTFKINVL